MGLKRLVLVTAFIISNFPLLVFADINIVNNTGSYGTAKLDFSPCSSTAGDNGIIRPYKTLTVSKSTIQTFCSDFTCEASLFMTKDCSGKKVAKAKVSAKAGVISVTNLDRGRFNIRGQGSHATIDPA